MRIVSVCRALPSPTDPSAGIYVFKRVAALAQRADVNILQPIFYFPIAKPVPEWATIPTRNVAGIEIQHCPTLYVPKWFKHLDSHWLRLTVGNALHRINLQSRVDLVDAHFGFPEGVACYLAAKRLGIPVFITLRGLEADIPAGSSIYKQLANALQGATGCICVSHALKSLAVDAGARPDKIHVIPNAIDRGLFFPAPQKAFRDSIGIQGGVPLIVSVGHLLNVKRHHILIGAFSLVQKRMPNARLVIIGRKMHEPDYPGRLYELVISSGLTGSVTFTGGLAPGEVATWLRAADVFSLVSRREGCCNAILEALAVGLPVVATPAGDNQFFVKHGINGYITPFDNERALAELLLQGLERTDWDRDEISRSLPVGNWSDVGRETMDFFQSNTQKNKSNCD